MHALRFGRSDIAKGSLILVNPFHPLPKDRKEEQMMPISEDTPSILLERQAAKMLLRAMGAIGCGQEIVPVSGYRTLREQEKIYEDSLRNYGEDFTGKYVAIPGCSEHQTGLAIDLAENGKNIDFICPSFPYTGICGRFREVAALYGFIERYPAGCESITCIAHEPWHFRYVGYPHSQVMKERRLTLEAYTDYIKEYPYLDRHLYVRHHWRDFEIFYRAVQEGEQVDLTIPDNVPYQVSGNNVNGIVVTLWRDRL